MTIVLICLPLISAFISWFTVLMGVRLFFHPVKPIPLGPFHYQGLLYKYEQVIKEELLRLIKQEISMMDPGTQFVSPASIDKIKPELDEHVDRFLKVKLKQSMPMIGMLIGDRTISQLKAIFMEELETLFPTVMKNFMVHIKEDIDADHIIRGRLNSLNIENLEKIIKNSFRNQLLKVQLAAALFGLFIGILQVIIIILFLPQQV